MAGERERDAACWGVGQGAGRRGRRGSKSFHHQIAKFESRARSSPRCEQPQPPAAPYAPDAPDAPTLDSAEPETAQRARSHTRTHAHTCTCVCICEAENQARNWLLTPATAQSTWANCSLANIAFIIILIVVVVVVNFELKWRVLIELKVRKFTENSLKIRN